MDQRRRIGRGSDVVVFKSVFAKNVYRETRRAYRPYCPKYDEKDET